MAEIDQHLQKYRDVIGMNIDGVVLPDEFEDAQKRASEIKAGLMKHAENEEERRQFDELWPYQDHEEVD